MNERQPGLRPEDEDDRPRLDGAVSQAKAWLIREARDFRGFMRSLEWPSHWPQWLRWPAMILTGVGLAAAMGVAALLLLLKAAEPSMPLGGDLYALNRPPALTFLDKNGEVAGVRGSIVDS